MCLPSTNHQLPSATSLWTHLGLHAATDMQIQRVESMAIASSPVVAAHARPAFGQSNDVFHTVAISKPDGGAWYAQLRLLFSCKGQDGRQHQLAFVRCYMYAAMLQLALRAALCTAQL